MASGPEILWYLTKESDNYTAFIKQLINIVIKSAIDKYELRNPVTWLHVTKFDILSTTKIHSAVLDKIHPFFDQIAIK